MYRCILLCFREGSLIPAKLSADDCSLAAQPAGGIRDRKIIQIVKPHRPVQPKFLPPITLSLLSFIPSSLALVSI
jgi:hypothetical protein